MKRQKLSEFFKQKKPMAIVSSSVSQLMYLNFNKWKLLQKVMRHPHNSSNKIHPTNTNKLAKKLQSLISQSLSRWIVRPSLSCRFCQHLWSCIQVNIMLTGLTSNEPYKTLKKFTNLSKVSIIQLCCKRRSSKRNLDLMEFWFKIWRRNQLQLQIS